LESNLLDVLSAEVLFEIVVLNVEVIPQEDLVMGDCELLLLIEYHQVLPL